LTDVRVVLVTTPADDETGARLARTLVDERLCACVSRIPGARSVYRWHGQIHDEGEELLVCKTTLDRVEALAARIAAIHPYDLPEVLVLDVTAGSGPYLDWVTAMTRTGSEEAP
jgi:periplasmic divalent cation tolerance protein